MASPTVDPRAPGAADTPLGAHVTGAGTTFCVWAPLHEQLHVRIAGHDDAPMTRDDFGYHTTALDHAEHGTRYTFVLPDGRALPDPASRSQPDGVHEASCVVATDFEWSADAWPAPRLEDLVLYELHVGTFTPDGTFDAIIPRLPELKDTGINAVQLMPIAQFPGSRNWGYDGAFAFAAQHSYGGPLALKRLVDAAHVHGMCVFLDVVYNHLGPEGNYLPAYAPVFTDVYHTPWGAALNYDEAGSDHIRRYFIESALQWTGEFRIDGLRVDAVHAIHDRSAQPFLRELTAAVHQRAHERGRSVVVIAESDLGDPRVMRPAERGGWDMDAQWLDDFHHSLRTLLTGDGSGYYADFGDIGQLARAYRQGYVFTGEYSRYRQRRHGAPVPDIHPSQFVVYAQNHDQVGNRMEGDRLPRNAAPAQLRLAAAATLLSPFTPMLFMGEEYGERRPFPYFVSHGDADLVEAVRAGRSAEFAAFAWKGRPPDPQAESTFESAVLDWEARDRDGHREMLALHRRLLELRRAAPAIRGIRADAHVIGDDVVVVRRADERGASALLLNFADDDVTASVDGIEDQVEVAVDTAAAEWGGPGAGTVQGTDVTVRAHSAMLLIREAAR
ncbi:MAG TPA: malto-oligosyltrehalose trehalohydrolase [Longimicrobiales bacterium]|nr:malto-oligosyltrehalose trehalohydrolase [Longimicrobiales bacterium]